MPHTLRRLYALLTERLPGLARVPRGWVAAWLLAVLTIATPPAVVQAKVILTIDPGVPAKTREVITRGIREAEKFYRDHFRLALAKDVEVILAQDKQSYAKALQRICKEGEEKSIQHAARSGGTSCPGGIAIPVTKQLDTMFFVAIHELTHKYQGAASPAGRMHDITWLVEGGATAIAGHIADLCAVESLPDLYKEYLGRFKGRRILPLWELRSSKQHNAARDKYPGSLVYAKESLAALELAKRRGPQSLFAFFLNQRLNHDSAKVFEVTYGIKLERFEQEFEAWLDRQLTAMPQPR